jgi:carbon monoxide dehydrogenase subunit G
VIVSGSTTVPMAAPQLWASLSDPERLGNALPHVDGVDTHGDGSFSAWARPRTALGETPLRMDFQIADRREGEYVRIVSEGTTGENFVKLSVELNLSPDGDSTQAQWTADVHVRGVLASLVQRSLPAILAEQVNEVLAAAAA